MSDVKITPLARRLAEENGIDWKQMSGSNPDGTIVERDVLAFLARVMAGEVDLPGSPDPEPMGSMPMPDAIPDFSQVQAALERQGVSLGDVVPKVAAPSVQTEEIPDLDLDFDLDLDEPMALPDLEEPIFAAEPAFAADEPILAPEPMLAQEPENATWPEPPSVPSMPDWNLGANPPVESRPGTPTSSGASSGASSSNWGNLSFEDAPPAPMPHSEPMVAQAEIKNPTLDDFVWDTPSPVITPEPALTWEDVPAMPQPAMPPVSAPVQESKPIPVIEEPEPIPAPAVPPMIPTPPSPMAQANAILTPAQAVIKQVYVWQRLVAVANTFESAMHLAESWKREVTTFPFLFRAAEKALADMESSMRALKGSLRGENLVSYRVAPSHTLRGTIESLEAASEPSDGLSVLSMEGTPYDQIIFPGATVLSLGRATNGMAILSLHGNFEAGQASALLDRIAHYLERPILLA